jgi:signal peptidase I
VADHFLKTENETATPTPKQKSDGVGEVLKIFVSAVFIAFLIRSFAYEPFSIPSGSMEPTLLVGDTLFVSKFAYGFGPYSVPFVRLPFTGRIMGSDPKRGDVVVFRLPTDPSIDYIKRVVGLPGDQIRVTNGRLYVNDQLVDRIFKGDHIEFMSGIKMIRRLYTETLPGGVEHSILEQDDTSRFDDTRTYTVPEDHFFMMGDNRDGSQDSRAFNTVGYVPAENLVGRAERIFYSIKDDRPFWEFWNWGKNMRIERAFKVIEGPID